MLGAIAIGAGLSLAMVLVGYIAWLRGGRRSAGDRPGPDGDWPTVDIVVPVHDEAKWIAAKLHNLDELDYPADRVRV